jgi:hypothetical protein
MGANSDEKDSFAVHFVDQINTDSPNLARAPGTRTSRVILSRG